MSKLANGLGDRSDLKELNMTSILKKSKEKQSDYNSDSVRQNYEAMRSYSLQRESESYRDDSDSDSLIKDSDSIIWNTNSVLKNSDSILKNSDSMLKNSDSLLKNSEVTRFLSTSRTLIQYQKKENIQTINSKNLF